MADVIQSVPDNQNNLPRLYKDISGNDTYFAETVAAEIIAGPAKTVISAHGTVNNSGSSVIAAAATFGSWITIQNVDPTNKLYVSATNPATSNDFSLAPAASITLQFGVANAIYGLSSGVSTAFAVIGA